MPLSARELLARLIKCEAGGEGDTGMKAVASVVMNRVNVPYGEYMRVNQGDLRKVITQPGQFTCLQETVGGQYNPQNVYNMSPDQIHYDIADWVIGGGLLNAVGESLWYFNPYNPECPPYFPANGTGLIDNRILEHCFYTPTQKYAQT
ncbi:MAG: cell wall hydrolase [Clostridia bacterium]|nr:cell wall hydrolase [Clostridia bacterium]MDR3645809.1 cell wall hydrolase [Clostridia bacterium]